MLCAHDAQYIQTFPRNPQANQDYRRQIGRDQSEYHGRLETGQNNRNPPKRCMQFSLTYANDRRVIVTAWREGAMQILQWICITLHCTSVPFHGTSGYCVVPGDMPLAPCSLQSQSMALYNACVIVHSIVEGAASKCGV
jgi:hypothetical protein